MQERRAERRSFVQLEYIDHDSYFFADGSANGPLIEIEVTDRG